MLTSGPMLHLHNFSSHFDCLEGKYEHHRHLRCVLLMEHERALPDWSSLFCSLMLSSSQWTITELYGSICDTSSSSLWPPREPWIDWYSYFDWRHDIIRLKYNEPYEDDSAPTQSGSDWYTLLHLDPQEEHEELSDPPLHMNPTWSSPLPSRSTTAYFVTLDGIFERIDRFE